MGTEMIAITLIFRSGKLVLELYKDIHVPVTNLLQ